MRKLQRLTVALAFMSSTCLAQISAPTETFPTSGAEYFVGRELGKPLITVDLLNGVNRPGVYHVPAQTNLAQLLSYAGGSLNTADLSEVRIRRTEHEKSLFSQHDMSSIKENEPFPILFDRDVVQVRERTNLDSTLKWMTLVSGIATTLLSIALISEINRNNK